MKKKKIKINFMDFVFLLKEIGSCKLNRFSSPQFPGADQYWSVRHLVLGRT